MFLKKLLKKQWDKERQYNPDSKNWGKNMRLSFMGTPCLRRNFYEYHREEPDFPFAEKNYKSMNLGRGYDDMLKSWLKSLGVLIEYKDKEGNVKEFPVNSEELQIKNGRVDAVINLQGYEGVKDGIWMVEFKSINNKGFSYIKSGPKKEHLTQTMGYVYLFEDNLKRGDYSHISELDGLDEVNGCMFIYINRENEKIEVDKDGNQDIFKHWWKEFLVEKDPQVFADIIDKIVTLQSYIKRDKLPPKTAHFCDWCSYREMCGKDIKHKEEK